MSEESRGTGEPGRWANAGVLFLLIATLLVQFQLADGWYSLGRQLWFDEILTQTLVADPSLSHSLKAISDGVDFNPPTLHLFLRAYCKLWGGASEGVLRSFSLLCALLALVGVYLTLKTTFPPLVACAATLGMWSQETLITEAFQIRFYSPWAALVAWLCYLLTRPDCVFLRRWHFLLRAVLAVLICTIHYFGIFSLALVVMAYCIRHRFERRRLWLVLWSVAPGLVALLACTPMFLGQRAALSVATWVSPVNLARVLGVTSMLLPMTALSVAAIAVYYSQLVTRDSPGGLTDATSRKNRGTEWLMASLIFMPLILLVFSLLVQPCMVPRYAIVGCLAFGPVIASLLNPCRRPVVAICMVIFLLAGMAPMGRFGGRARQLARQQQSLADAIRNAAGVPVIFENALDVLPIYVYEPDLREQIGSLDFETSEVANPTPFAVVNRDVLRKYTKHYPGLRLQPLKELRQYERLLVVRSEVDRREWSDYGEFVIRRRGERLFELVRRTDDD